MWVANAEIQNHTKLNFKISLVKSMAAVMCLMTYSIPLTSCEGVGPFSCGGKGGDGPWADSKIFMSSDTVDNAPICDTIYMDSNPGNSALQNSMIVTAAIAILH